ncbi:MAG: HNH endonuclease [Rhodococcus sp. (in: high G+C Gram-positive bacteria)]|uniref:HNH endonuclease signature motif containing protein n=1 Tax=Rhodococcus sp. TaxID=1831 RepID=UPI0011F95957|nr:HNH endonuclease signature motif containing protein [Rhodococcus sp. (in: high G+C Gram-positive bacteria)]RZL22447.1 MAG: HNH endonuclease [Rhodococcus sp. (in: high G+C Gram-positive bacteria)]
MFDSGVGSFGISAQLSGTETDCALVDLMAELHSCEAMLVERKLAVVAEFFTRRSAEHVEGGTWTSSAHELAESEVGAVLTMGRAAAGKLIGLGFALKTRLHRTRAAMARGELDFYRVSLIESATANVSDELIDEVERLLLEQVLAPLVDGGTGLTGRRLTAAIDRIVARVDPEGMRERRRRALADRFVGVSAAEDGMARILGSIPAEQARAFDGRLRELAMSVCRHDSRTYEQRRADALGALVSGSTVLVCDCDRGDCPQDRSGMVIVRRPLVHVVMHESTFAGSHTPGSDEPAHLDGYGVISAEHARDIAKDATIKEVRVPADPEPTYEPASASVYRPGATLDRWLRVIAGSCQWPHCDVPAWNCDLDHNDPFNHADPASGGKTVASNLSAFCRNHHRLKHSGKWLLAPNPDRSITLTSQTGHCYRTRAAGLLAGMQEPPPPEGGKPRRTRLENKAARTRSERKLRRVKIQHRTAQHAERKRRQTFQISTPRKRVPHKPVDYGDDPPPF